MTGRPDLQLITSPIPTAKQIARATWDSGEWRSADGRDLITYLVDELGPDEARALLNKADDFLARRGQK